MGDHSAPGEDEERIHRATSDDGTVIAGRVHGDGPPLVFFHGGLTDGDLAWEKMLPSVTDRFTCYLPSMRGTGLSDDHDDQRPERHMEDLAAFVDSIDEPVGLIGHSTGAYYGFGAIQRGANVTAMAAYEPAVFEFWEDGDDAERFHDAVVGMGEAAADGRFADGARSFLSAVSNEREMAHMESHGVFEDVGPYVPKLLEVLDQALESAAPNPNDPAQLAHVTIPVLLCFGAVTTTAHTDSVYYLDEQLPDSRVQEIPDVGHMAPEIEPEPLANRIVEFFVDERGLDGDRSDSRADVSEVQ